MKILLGSIAVLILLIGAQSAFALTEYQLGFKRGVNDANGDLSQGMGPRTATQDGMIPMLKAAMDEIVKHPHTYFQGWMDGFCTIQDIASDADEFTFDCSRESSQAQLGSGFQHANMSKLDWVNQPGNALDNQTHSFSDGYIKGWCSLDHLDLKINAELDEDEVYDALSKINEASFLKNLLDELNTLV
jgi:hypothetical protein